MTDGVFRTFRSDGSLQFDAGITPFVFQSKGVVTTVSTTGYSPHWSGNSPSSALIPMNRDSNELIAIYLPQYGYARYGNVAHPTTGVWYHVYHTMAPLGTAVTYYRFVPATELPPATYGPGIELYTEAGIRTFHSDMRPAVIAGTLSGLGATTTLPAGRTYASVVQSLAGHNRSFWDGGRESEYDDKGRLIWTYWTGYTDGKLYGVQWTAPNKPSLVEVWFDDEQIRMDVKQSPTVPANSEFFHIEIENCLFFDVTGL